MWMADGSSRFLQDALHSFGHTLQQLIRILNGASSRGRNFVVLFPFTATLRRRFADARAHQPFDFEPLERRVDRADGSGPAAALLDFRLNGAAVRLVTETHGGDQYELFELTEVDRFHEATLHDRDNTHNVVI